MNKTVLETNIKNLPGVIEKNTISANKIIFHLFYSTNCKYSISLLKKESQIKKILNNKGIEFKKYDQNHEFTKTVMNMSRNKNGETNTGYPFMIISDDKENIIDSFAGDRSVNFIKRKINALS